MNSFVFLALLGGCDAIRAVVIDNYPQHYSPEVSGGTANAGPGVDRHAWPDDVPRFSTEDRARERVSIHLQPVLTGATQPTEMVFFPGSNTEGFLLEKGGTLQQFNLAQRTLSEVVSIDVLTESEQGLIGAALHPRFLENGRFFLHTSERIKGEKAGVISEWSYQAGKAERSRNILDVAQPYANHNGGSMAFGPNGRLFVAFGDGGWRGDPQGHGQNGTTWLGSVLRIDVDTADDGQAYGVPSDNPWVGDSAVADEAWAIGLRNPWKFSFAPDGRMIVADVGQNAWEEVNLVDAKDNLGWNTKEASHCFPPDSTCDVPNLTDPIYEYAHSEGQSITGGYVATGAQIPSIEGHYLFADFVSGRMWAIPLPTETDAAQSTAKALGQWPVLPSTFGRSTDGALFVVGFGQGTVYRIEAG